MGDKGSPLMNSCYYSSSPGLQFTSNVLQFVYFMFVFSGTDCAECGNYLRLVFSFVAIALSTASSLIVLLLHCIDGL